MLKCLSKLFHIKMKVMQKTVSVKMLLTLEK